MKMYKRFDEVVHECDCDESQVEIMKAAGWSFEKKDLEEAGKAKADAEAKAKADAEAKAKADADTKTK